MEKIVEVYRTIKRHAEKLVAGGLLLGLAAISVDSIANTKKGSFVDPETRIKYEYILVDRRDSRHLYAWPENSHWLLASKIRDFNADGSVDHLGSFTYARLPFELNVLRSRPDYGENAQRLYDLALDNSQTR